MNWLIFFQGSVRYLDTMKTVLCYSSHSCGCSDSPGMTCRELETILEFSFHCMTLFCIFYKTVQSGGSCRSWTRTFRMPPSFLYGGEGVFKCFWWENGGPLRWESWLAGLVPANACDCDALEVGVYWLTSSGPLAFDCAKLHSSWEGLVLLQCTISNKQKFEYTDTESGIRQNKSPCNQFKSKNHTGDNQTAGQSH